MTDDAEKILKMQHMFAYNGTPQVFTFYALHF